MATTPDSDRGTGFRRWLRGLTPVRRRAVLAGLMVGYLVVCYVGLLVAFRATFGDADWADPMPGMLGGLTGTGAVLWLQRRRMGSLERAGEFDRAVRRGRLPDDAEPETWGRLLAGEQQFQRRARRLAVGLVVLVAVVLPLLMAWAELGWLATAISAIGGAGVVAIVWVSSGRRSAKIDRLVAQLEQADASFQ